MNGSRRRNGRIIIMAGASLLLSSCAGDFTEKARQSLHFGSHYNASETPETPQVSILTDTPYWWHIYNNDALNTMMQKAFNDNPSLNQVRARLVQAQAQAKVSRAGLFPTLSASGQASKQDGDNAQDSTIYSAAGAASYELDLWGKNLDEFNASKSLERASKEDIKTAIVSLSANIVENWLDILSLNDQISLAETQIENNKTILELQEKRFEMGSARALDILQQREILASSESLLPDLLSSRQQSFNNLSILIGEMPGAPIDITLRELPEAPPIPAAGLPSDILENRSDIVASWNRLASADWASNAAFKNRLPNFELNATYTTSATKLSALFETWLLDMAGQIALPIIDGGRLRAEQARQEAIADERYHAYRETVLNAVNEVENALTRNTYQDQKLDVLNMQYDAASKTLEQAQIGYANGDSSYINVLNSLNSTQSLEQQITREKLLQAKERVRLYRAIGGRLWADDYLKQNQTEEAE